jgi:hypothetical protein
VTYVPTFAEPRDANGAFIDTSPMDLVDVTGRRWVVLAAAISAKAKQNENTAALERLAGELERAIKRKASRRTTTRNKRVADVASREFEDPYLSNGIGARRGRWR